MKGIQQKSYLWVSSDNRTVTSTSTTSFNVKVQMPIRNVVSLDVVNAVIDYKAPNIVPHDMIAFTIDDLVPDPYTETAPSGSGYTVLNDVLEQLFPSPLFTVSAGENIGVPFATVTTTAGATMVPSLRGMTFNNNEIRGFLGLTTAPLLPTLGEVPPQEGVPNPHTPQLTWTFPVVNVESKDRFTSSLDGDATVVVQDVTRQTNAYGFPNGVRYSTAVSVKEAFQDLLPRFNVRLVDDALVLELPLSETLSPINVADHQLYVANNDFAVILGLFDDTILLPVLANGDGVLRWTFPRTLKLPRPPPYLFVQSQELGNNVTSAAGDINFFRMLIGKPSGADVQFLIEENQRVDFITNAPRDLNEIDVAVLLPDKTVVNNADGSFSMLLEIVQAI